MREKKLALQVTVFVMVLLLLILPGCAQNQAPEQQKQQIKVTDLLGREVTVNYPVQKVVLSFNFEEYMAVAGEEAISKIVGWNRAYWEGRRQDTWEQFLAKYPQINDIPDIGYASQGTFNTEKVITLIPDVVIMYRDELKSVETEIDRLQQAGIPVIFVDYHSQTIEKHEASTMLLGKILGQEERAGEIMDFYKAQVNKVYDKLADINGAKPKVYVELSTDDGPSAYGNSYGNTMWGALVENCRGINIAKDKVETTGALSPEYVLAVNPDVIILTGAYKPGKPNKILAGYNVNGDEAKKRVKNYLSRPGWDQLNAAKTGNIYAVYHDLSRHLYDFAGVQMFAKIFYPQEFKDLDPVANLKEFHDKFYPVDCNGTWMVGIGE